MNRSNAMFCTQWTIREIKEFVNFTGSTHGFPFHPGPLSHRVLSAPQRAVDISQFEIERNIWLKGHSEAYRKGQKPSQGSSLLGPHRVRHTPTTLLDSTTSITRTSPLPNTPPSLSAPPTPSSTRSKCPAKESSSEYRTGRPRCGGASAYRNGR